MERRTSSSRRYRSSACCRYRSIHFVIRSNTSASRCTGRRWASRLRLTRPASSSTLRCLETAWTVTSYGWASSRTVASRLARRATMSRRSGSASPAKTRDSGSAAMSASSCSTARLTKTLHRGPVVVNQLVEQTPFCEPSVSVPGVSTPDVRPPSPLDTLADRYVDEYAAADPVVATYIGVPGHDDEWPDLTLDGHAQLADRVRRTRAEAAALTPVDRRDEVARAAMLERLGAELERHEAGLAQSDLNTSASPLQMFRMIFDLMPTETEEHWATIGRRLTAMPAALDGYASGLRTAAVGGHVSAARQVRLAAGLARDWAGTPARPGFFAALVQGAPAVGALRADLDRSAAAAAGALLGFADRIEQDLLPVAPEQDAAGRERYQVESRYFTGVELDLEETYAWGWEELARIVAAKRTVAELIAPGQGVPGTMAALDADADRLVRGRPALQAWLQETADRAIAALDGVHFDIPAPVRTIEGRVIEVSGLGVY